jgi:hypothetical protein
MRQADSGPLQAGWIQAGLLQRVLSEAQTCQGTQKILNPIFCLNHIPDRIAGQSMPCIIIGLLAGQDKLFSEKI